MCFSCKCTCGQEASFCGADKAHAQRIAECYGWRIADGAMTCPACVAKEEPKKPVPKEEPKACDVRFVDAAGVTRRVVCKCGADETVKASDVQDAAVLLERDGWRCNVLGWRCPVCVAKVDNPHLCDDELRVHCYGNEYLHNECRAQVGAPTAGALHWRLDRRGWTSPTPGRVLCPTCSERLKLVKAPAKEAKGFTRYLVCGCGAKATVIAKAPESTYNKACGIGWHIASDGVERCPACVEKLKAPAHVVKCCNPAGCARGVVGGGKLTHKERIEMGWRADSKGWWCPTCVADAARLAQRADVFLQRKQCEHGPGLAARTDLPPPPPHGKRLPGVCVEDPAGDDIADDVGPSWRGK